MQDPFICMPNFPQDNLVATYSATYVCHELNFQYLRSQISGTKPTICRRTNKDVQSTFEFNLTLFFYTKVMNEFYCASGGAEFTLNSNYTPPEAKVDILQT